MAIYHNSFQVIGRSSGRSATAAAAYRAGEKIVDERTGEIHDYTRKEGVDYKEILLPENCGEWAKDRAQLWNVTELAEKRKDAQLAREQTIAIPVELTTEQGRQLVREYAQSNFVDKGMIADICIHGENTHNPHAHIMLSMREAQADGLGQKVRDWNSKEQLEAWRENWADCCNMALEISGASVTIDHRSYAEQGIDKIPTIHQGPAATEIHRKGQDSYIVHINTQIADNNRELLSAQKELQEINALLAEIQDRTPEKKQQEHGDEGAAVQSELAEAERVQAGVERMRAQAREWRLAQEEKERQERERKALEQQKANEQAEKARQQVQQPSRGPSMGR
jgi:ATP-dependent exoDNAse (exonuclease V) alpha subunit